MSGIDELKREVKEYIARVDTSNLFHFSYKKKIDDTSNIYIKDINTALKVFRDKNYIDASSGAWETVRYLVCKGKYNSLWEEEFYNVNIIVEHKLKCNEFYSNLCKHKNFDPLQFKSLLPFLGCLAETIAYHQGSNLNFFSRQMCYYYMGFWVCGWKQGPSETQNEYPVGKFYIYNGGI